MGLGEVGLLSGLLKIVDYLIVWVNELRGRKAAKVTEEKDRPRFRTDVWVNETTHPMHPTLFVVINSLGALPVTIHDGYVEVDSPDEPEATKTQSLAGKELSPTAPIEIQIPLRFGTLHPQERRETPIKVITKFSYGEVEIYEDT